MISQRFLDAFQLAFELHGQDTRKTSSVPVMAHLMSACALVLYDGGNEDEAIAALLHDTLEDKPKQITREEIETRFGNHVLEIIEVSTDTPKNFTGGLKPPWRERKEKYLQHARTADPKLLRVTIADKVDNARAMLASYETDGEQLWERFNANQQDQIWYYQSCVKVFEEAGVKSVLMKMLKGLVDELDELPLLSTKQMEKKKNSIKKGNYRGERQCVLLGFLLT